jgi:integrase
MSYSVAGKQVRETTGTADKEEAKRILAARVTGGKVPIKHTISKLLDGLILDYENNDQDMDFVRNYVEGHLRQAFGHLKAQALTKEHLMEFISEKRKAEYKNATINRALALLKRSFRLAEIPFPEIAMLRENNTRKGFVDVDQFWKIYQKLPVHQRPLVLFAYETGCRFSECISIKWDQLDFNTSVVRLNLGETKNLDGRVIPLSDMVMYLLRETLPRCSEYVFTVNGKPIKSVKTGWAKACKEAGFPNLLFHDLRRSAIRNMVRAGVPEAIAMSVSGHKTRSVFDRYNIVSEKDLKQAMQALDRKRVEHLYTSPYVPEIGEWVRYQQEKGPDPSEGGVTRGKPRESLFGEPPHVSKKPDYGASRQQAKKLTSRVSQAQVEKPNYGASKGGVQRSGGTNSGKKIDGSAEAD